MNKEAMVKINVRLPKYVVEHFRQYANYTGAVRAALVEHVEFEQAAKQKENDDGKK